MYIGTPKVHSTFFVEAERAHVTISVKHMLIFVITPLKPAHQQQHEHLMTYCVVYTDDIWMHTIDSISSPYAWSLLNLLHTSFAE